MNYKIVSKSVHIFSLVLKTTLKYIYQIGTLF